MAVKTMIVVDGSWLYHSRQALFESLGEERGFEIDYKRIPDIIAHEMADLLDAEVDVVRTNYFGTIPVNKQGYNPAKQKAFYEFLALQCAYDTEILEIDFRREPHARPDDKWVNVALASSMLYFAAVPGAYDVAIIVGGDADYIPLLKRVRAMGKRVQIVGMNNIEGKFLTSAMLLTSAGIQDMPPIFLDEHAQQVRLVREEQRRACKNCGREEVTTWAGPDFFCSNCRSEHRKQVRVCDTCGREEETTWDKDYFYCSQCRKEFRRNGGARAEETSFTI
jgi:RNA polymerase subunit RPABC4/transcription elongation factor Spt4